MTFFSGSPEGVSDESCDSSDGFDSTMGTEMEMFRFKEIGFDGGTSGDVDFVDSDGDFKKMFISSTTLSPHPTTYRL